MPGALDCCVLFINLLGKKVTASFVVYIDESGDEGFLFGMVSPLKGSSLMRYENSDEVNALAKEHHFEVHPIAMKNTHNSKKIELLISKNLDWLR